MTSGLQSIGQHLSALEPDGVGGARGARKVVDEHVGRHFGGVALTAEVTAGAAV